MSKAAMRNQRSRSAAERTAATRTLDRGIYGAILLVVAFILLLWFLLWPETFREAVVGAAVALLGWINVVAIKAYRGAKLPQWQRSLAKIPLQFAGYGTERGRPLEAAKGQRNARNAIFMFLGSSVVVVLLLAWALIG